jgi:hypothetical protein
VGQIRRQKISPSSPVIYNDLQNVFRQDIDVLAENPEVAAFQVTAF